MTKFGERKLLGRVSLSDYTEVRVSTCSKDDVPCVDARMFFANMDNIKSLNDFMKDKPLDDFIPTKKGLFLEVPKFVELMKKHLIPLYEEVAKE